MTQDVTDPPLSSPPEIEEIVEALREDPVLVHSLFGNGRTDAVRSELRDRVEAAEQPVYIVMIPAPAGLSVDDPATELATLLQSRIGDGLFFVKVDPQGYQTRYVGFGEDAPDDVEIRQEVSSRMPPREGDYERLTPAGEAAYWLDWYLDPELASWDRHDSYVRTEPWAGPAEPSPIGDGPVIGDGTAAALAFVVVAGVGWQALRNVARWRETALPSRQLPPRGLAAAPPAELRAVVEAELTALAAALDRPAEDHERRQFLDGCYDTARLLLAHAGDDVADLTGALVLTRAATNALPVAHATPAELAEPPAPRSSRWRRRRAARLQRQRAEVGARRAAAEAAARRPYRPCFLDPRHGAGTQQLQVTASGGSPIRVPLCADCADDPDRVTPLQVTTRRHGRRRTAPYFEVDSVWSRTGYGAFVDDLWRQAARDLEARR